MRGRFLERFTPHVSQVQGGEYPSSEEGTRQSYLFNGNRFAAVASQEIQRGRPWSATMIFTFSGIYASAAQRAQCTVLENPGIGIRAAKTSGKEVSRRPLLSFAQLTEAHLIPPNFERAPFESIEP